MPEYVSEQEDVPVSLSAQKCTGSILTVKLYSVVSFTIVGILI